MKKISKTAKNSHQSVFGGSDIDDFDRTQKVRALAVSLCRSEGFELLRLEYRLESGESVLRLYIDKPGGITLDDCANISRQLGDILDVEWGDCAPYKLEVSSPGLKLSS